MTEPFVCWILLAHGAATLYMVGLIWFVQVVHYPLLAAVGGAEFAAYELRHTSRTAWVVGPPMLVEAATGISLFWIGPPGLSLGLVWGGAGLLALLWLSTALLQVPCHQNLSRGFDARVHQRLVATNWLRTIAWSLRGCLVVWMIWKAWTAN